MNEVEIPNKLREACDKAWEEIEETSSVYDEDLYEQYNKLVDKYLKDD